MPPPELLVVVQIILSSRDYLREYYYILAGVCTRGNCRRHSKVPQGRGNAITPL